jgi:glycosyltransferase involved in cell wall biosynthesis
MGTFQKKVGRYIALSQFSREKFIQGGLSAEKIIVKPNFIHPDPRAKDGSGEFLLFVGRLSPEKGVTVLLQAIRQVAKLPVRIVGDGPLMEVSREYVEREHLTQVQFLGRLNKEETISQMKQARALIFPSECYENFPLVIAEAFACGLPVIASRHGAVQEMVEEGKSGLMFTPSHTEELAARLNRFWSQPEEAIEMGKFARSVFEARYTAAHNLELLLRVYQDVLAERNA